MWPNIGSKTVFIVRDKRTLLVEDVFLRLGGYIYLVRISLKKTPSLLPWVVKSVYYDQFSWDHQFADIWSMMRKFQSLSTAMLWVFFLELILTPVWKVFSWIIWAALNSDQRIGFSFIQWTQFLHKFCLTQERTAVTAFFIKINVLIPEIQVFFLN